MDVELRSQTLLLLFYRGIGNKANNRHHFLNFLRGLNVFRVNVIFWDISLEKEKISNKRQSLSLWLTLSETAWKDHFIQSNKIWLITLDFYKDYLLYQRFYISVLRCIYFTFLWKDHLSQFLGICSFVLTRLTISHRWLRSGCLFLFPLLVMLCIY